MAGLRNKNHWTLPYVYSGRRGEVHISLIEDKDCDYFEKFLVYCGAAFKIANTFEEARELAYEFTHGGAL